LAQLLLTLAPVVGQHVEALPCCTPLELVEIGGDVRRAADERLSVAKLTPSAYQPRWPRKVERGARKVFAPHRAGVVGTDLGSHTVDQRLGGERGGEAGGDTAEDHVEKSAGEDDRRDGPRVSRHHARSKDRRSSDEKGERDEDARVEADRREGENARG